MKIFLSVLLSVWLFCDKNVATTAEKNIGGRIVGGEFARAGQFPFAAAIYIQTANGRFFCGGTLITNQWVITAGHCVDNAISFTVQLGSTDLESDDPYRVVVASSTYVLHPDFNPETIEHDIGLIKLRLAVEYDIYIHPINPMRDELSEDTQVYILGWGQTSDSEPGLTNELKYLNIITITNAECQLTYGSQITENMVCAAGNFNEGTCIGDNGGALAVQNGRTYALVGIASFVSSEGCESVHPSGFTRISPYYTWIVNTTQEID